MKFALLALVISFSAFADYKSESAAIDKFDEKEFRNSKNYEPKQPGRLPNITDEFKKRLMSNPQELKYFVVLKTVYRLIDTTNNDKALKLSLESKFGGKKLDKDKWEKIIEYLANPVLAESKDDHVKAISSREGSDAHYEKHKRRVLNASSF